MSGMRRQRWWNSVAFEGDFKKRQIVRVLAFTLAFVAISGFCVGTMYAIALEPLVGGELPFYLRAEMLRQSGVPGMTETLLVWVTLMGSLSAFFAVAVGLYFSHKLAGPIYRFKIELQRIAEGQEARPIRLRKGDDFQDVADALNSALGRIQSGQLLLQGSLESAEHRLQELVRAVHEHADDPEAMRAVAAKVEAEG